jgi:dephospho-CoA kinase
MLRAMEQVTLIGLTGGIAVGKTTVARIFAELGAPVIDADALAREVTAPGTEVLERIVEAFGEGVLDSGGRLDRKALGRIVFSDVEARRRLEAITHPAIIAAAGERVDALGRQGHRVVLYEAALLIEAGRHRDMDSLIVVVADDEQRVSRLMQRNELSREEAVARLAAQLPQERKVELADHVIDNSGSLEQTRARVEEVWSSLQEER